MSEIDATTLWSCACNCLLYEHDSAHTQVNIGSTIEPKMVPGHDASLHFYARVLIGQLNADITRLHTADYTIRRQVSDQNLLSCAMALSALAQRIIMDAGAETDDKPRRRLLASIRHTVTMATFGAHSATARASAAQFAAELDDIDDH